MDAVRASEPNKPSKRGFIKSLSDFIGSYATLFSIELNEAKKFAWAFFVHIVILVLAIMFFAIVCSVGIIAYFWESYRLTAIFAVAGFYLIVILISLVSLVRLKKNTQLFVACKEELAKEKELLFDE